MRSIFLPLTTILSGAVLLSACGSDSSSSNYDGYMPKFSSQYLSSSPQSASVVSASLMSDTSAQNRVHQVTQTTSVDVEAVDCRNATAIFNASPQAANFDNSAIDFIRNMQAQTNFYDCIVREQVFSHSADVLEESDGLRIVSAFDVDKSSYYSSWKIPATLKDTVTNADLAVAAQGRLINLQPDIDKSKTRVDLTQNTASDGQFVKVIQTTLLDKNQGITNIRSSHIVEIKDAQGVLTEQKVAGRITFENKITAVTAMLKPGVGVAAYVKQCDESTAGTSNDYERACGAPWQISVYNNQLQSVSGDAKAQLLTQLGLTTEGDSVLPEVTFFFGMSETDFFDSRDLPRAINADDVLLD